jgi:hypothetical protein
MPKSNKSYVSHNYVLGLDIAVQNRVRMQMMNPFNDLSNDDSHAFLSKSALFIHEIKQMTVWAKLNEEIDILTIVKEIV